MAKLQPSALVKPFSEELPNMCMISFRFELACHLLALIALVTASTDSLGCLMVPVYQARLNSERLISIAASVHISVTRLTVEQPCKRQVFETPDDIYFESVPGDPEREREIHNALLQLKLSPGDLDKYRTSLADDLDTSNVLLTRRGIKIDKLENLHPYLAFQMIVAGCETPGTRYSVDTALKSYADQARIPTHSLEDPSIIIGLAKDQSVGDWILHIASASKYVNGGCVPSLMESFDDIYRAYSAGNLKDLYRANLDLCRSIGSCLAVTNIELSAARDEYLADRIIKLSAKSRKILVVLGAAHLAPQSGLIAALNRAGFSISRL